jgi:molybdate transport system substrate-binding protein
MDRLPVTKSPWHRYACRSQQRQIAVKRSIPVAVGLVSIFLLMTATHGTELKVMSPIAIKPLLTKVGKEFSQSTGNKIVFVWSESGGIKSDIEKGVQFDIVILTPNFVDDLIKQGKLDGATRTPIARSGIGVAIRKGMPKPDVSTTDAFKRTLINAKSIGFVERSSSSRYLPDLFDRLGIAEAIKSKLKPLPGPVHEFLAKGDPEIAITQIAAVLPFDDLELVGPLPSDIQRYTTFVGVASSASSSDTVRTLLKALASPSNAPVLRSVGLDPPN